MKPIVKDGGLIVYALEQLETLLQKNAYWLLKECEQAIGKTLTFSEEYIEENSYELFIKWYNKTHTNSLELPKKINKRKYSTTHRIHIAYKTKYHCAKCSQILPPEFEVDHILALHLGGKDEFSNLAALCPNCHAIKTRCEILKRDAAFQKEFSKRLETIQGDIFAKFKRKPKESNYFSQRKKRHKKI